MGNFSTGVDQYILNAKPFAQIILDHIRLTVHQACPEVEEKLKWGMPHFDYKGKMMCAMAAFKEHCSLGFHKASIMRDPKKVFILERGDGMGNFGKIKSIKDLPSVTVLKAYIKEAMVLNDEDVKVPRVPKVKDNTPPEIPDYFAKALKSDKNAHKNFKAMSAACQREYVQWITEAKTEPTRLKRMDTALEWIAEGKKRNWKYESKS